MSESGPGQQPERLLSEALRAQASAPAARPEVTNIEPAKPALPTRWVLLLALLLGLAAGSVVGLLSLL